MRDPTLSAAGGEATLVKDAIESARVHLHWTLISDRRWVDSRWSGNSPKDEREKGFDAAVEIVQKIINDPACDELLQKHARVPGARPMIIAMLEIARPRPPKKGEVREQMNALRNEWIAAEVAQTCRYGAFSPTRNRGTKIENRRESGCSIVAEALRLLGVKPCSEKSVADIWAKHGQAYHHLLPR